MISETADCTANLIVNDTIVGYMDFIPVTPTDYDVLQKEPFTKDFVAMYMFGGNFDIYVSMFSIDPNFASPANYLLFFKWMIDLILKWKEEDIHIGRIAFSIYNNYQVRALKSLGFTEILTNQLKGYLYGIRVSDLLQNSTVKERFVNQQSEITKFYTYDDPDEATVKNCKEIATALSVRNGGILQYEDAAEESDVIITAEISGKIAGYICLRSYDVLDGIYFEQIAVKKEYRRRGIGKELVRRALEYAKDHGFSKVYANCKKINNASKALLQKTGFIPYDMTADQYAGIGFQEEDVDKNLAFVLAFGEQ